MRLAKARRIVSLALVFPAFTVGSAVLSATLPLVHLATPDRRRAVRRSQTIMHRALGAVSDLVRVLDLVRFDRRAHATDDLPPGPCVLVANHPTLVDVIQVLACYDRTCVVAKREHIERHLVGAALRCAGHIDGGDGQLEDAQRVIDECLARLTDGYSVLIFPEGTRSPVGDMHAFHRGAFEIAARAGVPVVPLAISCEPPALKKGMPWHALAQTGADYAIERLAPVAVARGRASTRAAAVSVRELIVSAEKRLRLAHGAAERVAGVVTGPSPQGGYAEAGSEARHGGA